jgi:predicted kinase
MTTPSEPRSVRISDDERGGWSSDRPRKSGAPPREQDVSVRGRVLKPTDLLRYSPGSLLIIASPSVPIRERFAQRLIEQRNALISLQKVRDLIAGRVPEDQMDEKAVELMDATVAKRLEAGETVVITAGVAPDERERHVKTAARFRRPRHLILLEAPRDEVAEDDRAPLNDLRRRLDASELGADGFHSALRLAAEGMSELKRLVFRPEPRDE